MRTYDFVIVSNSMTLQYKAPIVCQKRVPDFMLGVIITRKYRMFIVLGQCHEIFGINISRIGGARTAPIVRVSVLVCRVLVAFGNLYLLSMH
jgi:hypothetical protein